MFLSVVMEELAHCAHLNSMFDRAHGDYSTGESDGLFVFYCEDPSSGQDILSRVDGAIV